VTQPEKNTLETILVVEDQAPVLQAVCAILERAGFACLPPVVARRQFRRKVLPRERGKWSSGPAAGSAASGAIVPEGMGFSIAIKRTFQSRRKGDIFIEGRQRVFRLSRIFWGVSEMLRASVITSKPATHDRPKSGQPDSRQGRLFRSLDQRQYPYCPRSHTAPTSPHGPSGRDVTEFPSWKYL